MPNLDGTSDVRHRRLRRGVEDSAANVPVAMLDTNAGMGDFASAEMFLDSSPRASRHPFQRPDYDGGLNRYASSVWSRAASIRQSSRRATPFQTLRHQIKQLCCCQLEAEAFGALSCTQLANQLAQRRTGGDSSVSRDPESTACSIFNSYLRSDFKQKAVRALG